MPYPYVALANRTHRLARWMRDGFTGNADVLTKLYKDECVVSNDGSNGTKSFVVSTGGEVV